MRGENLLTKPWQYAQVYRTGKSWASRWLMMKAAPGGALPSRYGISVSRRIGTAVVRNRVKRRFREILRQTAIKAGWDIVIVARPAAAGASFATLRQAVYELLSQAQLLRKEDEDVSLIPD